MRRLFALPLALVVFALAAPPVRGDEVLEASRKEKARQEANKKKTGKSTKKTDSKEVLSNTGLKKAGQNAKFSQVGGTAGTGDKDGKKDGTAEGGKDAADAKDKGTAGADKDAADKAAESAWRDRLAGAEGKVSTARKELEELNQKINDLRRMSSAADDPNVRLRTSDELRVAESQIPKAQQAITDAEKGVTDLREEARRAGVPSGWLR